MKQCIFCGKESDDNKVIESFLEQDKGICLSCLSDVTGSMMNSPQGKAKRKMYLGTKNTKLLKPYEIKAHLDNYDIWQESDK